MLKQVATVALLAFIIYHIVNLVDFLGYYQRTYNHRPGSCRRLEGIEHGSGDIHLLPNGLAFISSGVVVQESETYNNRVGKIFLFDFNNPEKPPHQLPVKAADGTDFKLVSPFALSAWNDSATGKLYLYVMRYGKMDAAFDKFLFDQPSKTLTHVRHIANEPNFHMLDNFAVVGEDQLNNLNYLPLPFFYTNWVYSRLDWLEMVLGVPWGSLGFFDGHKATLIETGMFTPNGVALSPDGKFLYVACTFDREFRVYRRQANNSVTFDNSVKVNTDLDNLFVDAATGDLWFGAHPVAWKVLKYMDDPSYHSPSQVMRVRMLDGKALGPAEEIYSDDGSQISASSVAVVHGSGLLIGSMATHAVYCSLDDKQ
jgi:arylesterase/paraoxonase